MEPYVSVIIPHLNDSSKLKLCIDSLKNQTYPNDLYEIIVIDNGSSNKHLEKLENLNNQNVFKLLHEKESGSYAARNKGLENAKGKIIAFLDSDCIAKDDWIEKGNAYINKENCGLVGGKIILFSRNSNKMNSVELYETVFVLRQDLFIENNYAATANLFTSINIFDQVGNFNNQFKSHGDKEWCLRVHKKGYKIVYSEEAIVYHPTRYSFKNFVKRQLRLFGGDYNLNKQNGISSFNLFFTNLFNLIPPIILLFKISQNENIKIIKKRIDRLKVYILFVFLRYLKVYENFRLLLGFKARNF